uniref:Uncharacterized protein n=1 Tax=Meloidogyne incognita TaxID=6306 RepID=A0A914KFL6_MELIC
MAMLEGVVAPPHFASSSAGLSSSRSVVSSSFGGPNFPRLHYNNNNSLRFNSTSKFSSLATTHNNKKMLANHQKSNDFVFKASGNQDGGEIEKEDGGEKQMSKEDEEILTKKILVNVKKRENFIYFYSIFKSKANFEDVFLPYVKLVVKLLFKSKMINKKENENYEEQIKLVANFGGQLVFACWLAESLVKDKNSLIDIVDKDLRRKTKAVLHTDSYQVLFNKLKDDEEVKEIKETLVEGFKVVANLRRTKSATSIKYKPGRHVDDNTGMY